MNYKALMIAMTATAGVPFTACNAQSIKEADVPQAAMSQFQQKFPDAKKVEWSKESANEIEAEFKMNGQEMSANFSNTGEWLETETEIKEKDLPEAVKNTLKSQFADYDIEESEQVSTPEQSKAYEVELEKGETTLDVMLDQSGKVIKQTTSEDEDKEDNDGR